MLGAVSHQQVFVPGVKANQAARRKSFLHKDIPAVRNKYAFNEVLSQNGIVQTALFFYRQIRKGIQQFPRKDADTGLACRPAVQGIHFHALKAAGGRFAFQDITAEMLLFQAFDHRCRPA